MPPFLQPPSAILGFWTKELCSVTPPTWASICNRQAGHTLAGSQGAACLSRPFVRPGRSCGSTAIFDLPLGPVRPGFRHRFHAPHRDEHAAGTICASRADREGAGEYRVRSSTTLPPPWLIRAHLDAAGEEGFPSFPRPCHRLSRLGISMPPKGPLEAPAPGEDVASIDTEAPLARCTP